MRKSTLKRVSPEVFGTVACRCAPENMMRPPGGQTTRNSVSRSSASCAVGCHRESLRTSLAAFFRAFAFHSYMSKRSESFCTGLWKYFGKNAKVHSEEIG